MILLLCSSLAVITLTFRLSSINWCSSFWALNKKLGFYFSLCASIMGVRVLMSTPPFWRRSFLFYWICSYFFFYVLAQVTLCQTEKSWSREDVQQNCWYILEWPSQSVQDPSQFLWDNFSLLPSGCRCILLQCRTYKLKRSYQSGQWQLELLIVLRFTCPVVWCYLLPLAVNQIAPLRIIKSPWILKGLFLPKPNLTWRCGLKLNFWPIPCQISKGCDWPSRRYPPYIKTCSLERFLSTRAKDETELQQACNHESALSCVSNKTVCNLPFL